MPSRETKAKFIEPMLLLPVEAVPEGRGSYELKLDGYRAVAIKTGAKFTSLRSNFGVRTSALA